ncbi:heavy metal-associated domain-containing protein [Micromonospora sp. CPCC 206060]|uniref:heavy-metal-associated domain-containing protein n=1 Tax=Micromonospora sp. CPCC 206060 TaxID=3122406 RepID=UPI002FF30B2A
MCTTCDTDAQTLPTTDEGREFVVAGMSCQPCATKVGAAVRAVPGVTDVRVDLAAARITVLGSADENRIRAAVTDAGYRITDPEPSR